MPDNKNNVYLNNVVYDLTKIENPHLKQALNERNEQKKFMFNIFKRHHDHSDHCDNNDNDPQNHYDSPSHTDHAPNWDEWSEKYGDAHSEYNESDPYYCDDWG